MGQPRLLQRLPADVLRAVAVLRHPHLLHRPPIRVFVEDRDDLEVGELVRRGVLARIHVRSEEHTSELQSLMRISYAVFCLKKNTKKHHYKHHLTTQHTTQSLKE